MDELNGGITQVRRYQHRHNSKIAYRNVVGAFLNVRSALNVALLLIILGSVFGSKVFALGVGAASPSSYIGEPLSVHIPLFNVSDPESLDVSLTQISGLPQGALTVDIERANSKLGVRVHSVSTMNEPFLRFSVDITDSNATVSKEFTVLLNLLPGSGRAVKSSKEPQVASLVIDSGDAELVSSRVNGSVMGPYDWAKAGNIPETFGAVIGGQSLWRVARRINKAMGVSINQMMWGLYEENPDAFTSVSVDSLQVGSFLKIPTHAKVTEFSDLQAREQLSQLVGSKPLVTQVSKAQGSEQAKKTLVNQDHEITDLDENASFQLTAIDEAVRSGDAVSAVSDPQSQQIISSLAATVGNLTQELIRKDKQISFLSEKVAAFEEVAKIDADTREELSESNGDAFNNVSSVDGNFVDGNQASLSEVDEFALTDPLIDEAKASSLNPFWLLPLLAITGLITLGLLFRTRISDLVRSLNLFGSNDEVDFEDGGFIDEEIDDFSDGGKSRGASISSLKDYSIASAAENIINNKETIAGISYLSNVESSDLVKVAGDSASLLEFSALEFSSQELSSEKLSSEKFVDEEFVDEEFAEEAASPVTVQEEDLSLQERLDHLIKEGDFDFARELLDFARYNEIEDEQYHCERLRLFQAMKDEDGFYGYYYEIESKIPNFEPQLQTQISRLVVQLAQY